MTDSKRKSYANTDAKINIAKNDSLQLANTVIHQFKYAVANLDSSDIEMIRRARELSDKANSLQSHINQKSILHLAKQKSSPLELRVMLTTLKITNELTLVNVQAETIARRAEIFIKQSKPQQSWGKPHIAHCASLALDMMNKSINAFSLLDANSATQTIHLYEQVAEEYNFITSNLMDHLLKGPRSISVALDILYIAKAIERIANHAKSISQHVIDIISQYEKDNVTQTEAVAENS